MDHATEGLAFCQVPGAGMGAAFSITRNGIGNF
jgi:hypothetical protein